MEAHLKGNHGHLQETEGKTEAIIVPISLAHKLEEYVEENDLVDEHWVIKTFKITKKTLCNYISSKKIPRCDYTVAFNKARFFFRSKLFGLKNLLTSKKIA
jgi:hypothetical protein